MTYAALETSIDSGCPVELYEFSLGAEVWRYTSADANQTHGGHTYTSITLSRSEIEDTDEINQATLPVNLPADNPVADLFRIAAPSEVVLLTIWAKHRTDAEAIVIFLGRVLNCEWSGSEATLSAEPVSTSVRQPGLRRTYSRYCPHMLFSQSPGTCTLNKDDWDATLTVSAVSGRDLTVSGSHASTDSWFAGGSVLWIDGSGRGQRRMVESHAGGAVTLAMPIPGLSAGASLTAWPGCDHTLTSCRDKFSNNLNYGGFKWIPGVDPWTNPVF